MSIWLHPDQRGRAGAMRKGLLRKWWRAPLPFSGAWLLKLLVVDDGSADKARTHGALAGVTST